jgi:hypothetical protein
MHMAIVKYERSIASVSWIDPVTGLPEVDRNTPNGPLAFRSFLTGDRGFRFCNFLEAYATYDTTARRVVGHGFTTASRLYRAPSFAHLPSQIFTPMRDINVDGESIVFTQIVGARTESPEIIGREAGTIVGGTLGPVVGGIPGLIVGPLVGRYVGKRVAHSYLGFPPIWSQLRLRVFPDGRFTSELMQHSHFPSLTFYEIHVDASGNQTANYWRVDMKPGVAFYNAVPNLDRWKAEGWGPIRGGGPGPTSGNPWNLQK